MNYVWLIKPIELFNNGGTTHLYMTHVKKIKFGEELFANNNGYVQHRKTENPMGLVLKSGKNLNMLEHFKLAYKLKKKVAKEILKGKNYTQYE